MSYKCDVYVYEDYEYGLTCCFCTLDNADPSNRWSCGDHEDMMLEHLLSHVASGDRVPTHVLVDLGLPAPPPRTLEQTFALIAEAQQYLSDQ